MLFEVSEYLGKSSMSRIPLAEEQTKKKIKIYKTLIRLRFAKINPRKKSTGSQFAKLNPRQMIRENKSTRKFLS